MTIRNFFCGMRSTIFFAAAAPIKEAGTNNRNPKRNCFPRLIPLNKYVAIRVESMNKAIAPAVEIYTAFDRSKAERKTPRIAPPTPKIPAKNPDKLPPLKAVKVFLGILNLGFKNRKIT